MGHVLKGVEGAMRGYRPQVDWGGEEGSATIMVGSHNVKVGTAGWRRRCLFVLLLVLLLIAIINLILTLWILRKICFNTEGAGNLHIVVGGAKLDGTTRLDHQLTLSQIQGRQNEDLELVGYLTIMEAIVKPDGTYASKVVLNGSGLTAAIKGMRLKNEKGDLLFEARGNGTTVGAKFFTVTGTGGAIFRDSLQTERVLGDDVHEFRVESKTRSVVAYAANQLKVEARDGDVTATALEDATLGSAQGKFRFESPNLFMPNLLTEGEVEVSSHEEFPATEIPPADTQIPRPEIASPTVSEIKIPGSVSSSGAHDEHEEIEIFQVCVCPSGRLFLSAAESVCNPDELTCK